MIIDMHLHIFSAFAGSPDRRGTVSLRYGQAREGDRVVQVLPPSFEHTSSPPEIALGYMDHVGVDRALLTQGPLYGLHNDYVAQAVYRWPARFAGLAMYNPFLGQRGPDDLERWMTEAGFVGVKLEMPNTRRIWPQIDLLGEAEMRVWERCAGLHGLLMLHLEEGSGQCGQVLRIADAFPGLRILVCHLGLAPSEGWQEQVRLAHHERIYLDIAALPYQYRHLEEYPFPQAQKALEWAVREVGADKMVWGSDYPGLLLYNTYGQLLDLVRAHCPFLSPEERAFILGGTAERLLGKVGRDRR